MTVVDARGGSLGGHRMETRGAGRGCDDVFVQSCEISGRAHMRCVSTTARGDLGWTHVRQLHPNGALIFEFATEFALNDRSIDDRLGERLLDSNDLRVDGTHRTR